MYCENKTSAVNGVMSKVFKKKILAMIILKWHLKGFLIKLTQIVYLCPENQEYLI